MRGFQAASLTLSDKAETILKSFSVSYSLQSCIVLRSKIILRNCRKITAQTSRPFMMYDHP